MAVQRAGPTLSRSLPAIPGNVGRLRRTVAEFARGHGGSTQVLDSVNLAVSEALTNVVVHAYRNAAAPGPVVVGAVVRDRTLIVTVSDEGCGMTPRDDSPGLGLGLGLMSGLADTFDIKPRAGRPGVVLRMVFGLAG